MMDDLILKCCRRPEDFLQVQDEEHGATALAINGNIEQAGVVLTRVESTLLRNWLIAYLRPYETEPTAEVQLRQARAALKDLMKLLPHLVRLADRVGVDLSEQHWIDKAQAYIDIYEGIKP